jgi:hypothetical protein
VTVTNEVKTPDVTIHTPDVKVVNEVVSPQVNVTNEVRTPDVTVVNEVVSPSVHVEAPNVTVEPPTVELTVAAPARRKLINRDEKGQIVSIEDGD